MKPIKVFYNGKPLRNIYPHATKWQVFKYRVKRAIRRTAITIWAIGMIMAIFQYGQLTSAQTVQNVITQKDTLSIKIEQLENDLLDSLSACESAGKSADNGIITFDTNSKASIGVFQFQIATVQHYAKTLQGETLTPREAIYLALDENSARVLAREIIFTQKKGLENWHNCANKKGLYTQLDLINKLKQ